MKHLLQLLIFISFSSAFAQIVNVSTSTELQNALDAATAGQTIVMADGIYYKGGGFKVAAGINGTSTNPITLKGSKNAILTNNDPAHGYSIGFAGNSYWIVDGFTLYASQKGIVIDNSHHNIIQNLKVYKMGFEGIHLRTYSSFNTVQNCFVDSTGLTSPGTGEGIYIGSANSNWATYTGDANKPDTSNYNQIVYNTFGDHIGSENIDIKEGTTGGYIAHNTFNGKGLNGVNSGDSWIDMKGNYYRVECNTGEFTLTDGLQAHIAVTGWGDFNSFENNTLTINGSGYGINIQKKSGKGVDNTVCTNNTAIGAAAGLTNLPEVVITCSGTCGGAPTCTATITSPATSFCTGGSVVLTASAGQSYKWFKNGTQVTGSAITYTANAAGSYTVEVTYTGACSATSVATVITVAAAPTPTITSPATSFCTGGSVILTASAGQSYKWFKNGTQVTGSAITYLANAGGSYTVEVTYAGGCSATSTGTAITVAAAPTPTITSPATSFCTGGSVTLTASAGNSYKWFKNGTQITGSAITYSANAAGSYTVEVTYTGGCSATSVATAITVAPAPTPTITSPVTSFCTGAYVTLTASAGQSYKWFKNGTQVTGSAITYSANTAGSYTVEVTYTGGCSATSVATAITVAPAPTPTITSPATSFCTGGSVVLTASAGNSYKWFKNGTQITGSAITYSANTAGTYTVEVTYTGGCSATSTATAITVAPAPTPTITSPTTSFCTGGSVTLTASAGQSYKWFKNGTQVTGSAITYSANAAGSFTVEVSYTGGCSATSTATAITVTTSIIWYADTDGDGKGDATNTLSACTQPAGYVSTAGDGCPTDANKIAPGLCGCGVLESSCTNQAQTITFTPFNANQSLGDPDFELSATSSSGLTITFTSSNPNVAIIIGNKVQIVGAGTTIITATQSGNSMYAPSTISQPLTIAGSVSQAAIQVLDGTTILQNNSIVLPIGSAPINTQTGNKTILIKNIGASDLIINSVSSTSGFTVIPQNISVPIKPNETATLLISGTPTDINAPTVGSINITSNDPNGAFTLNVSVTIGTTTSTFGSLLSSQIELFPNPTTGNVSLRFNGTFEEVIIQLFSVDGKFIKEKNVGMASNMEEQLSIQEQPNGVYFIEIKTKQGTVVKRIIKQ